MHETRARTFESASRVYLCMHDTRAHIVLLKLADADACVNLILERHLLVADGREIFFYRLSRILLGLKLGLHLN